MKSWLLTIFFTGMIMSYMEAQSASMPSNVNWYRGKIEAAFDMAKEKNRPLFLYWGAVWCPPCNKMKKTLFATEEFKKAVAGYIPVYLDGDDVSAQKWGEKLGVRGYPTMLIYSAQGSELMRLPIGASLSEYVSLLNSIEKRSKNIKDVLNDILAGKGSESDWKIFSSYSWDQDSEAILKDGERVGTIKKVLDLSSTQSCLIKSKIFFYYLSLLILDKKNEISADERATLRNEFLNYLRIPDVVFSNFESIVYNCVEILDAVVEKKQISEFEETIIKSMANLRNSDKLSLEQRVSSFNPEISFATKDQKKCEKKLVDLIITEVQSASKNSVDAYDRQDVMSSAIDLLMKVEQFELAKTLASVETKKAVAPFYFMLELAAIAEKEQKIDEAIRWKEQAWLTSTGGATRFQMGAGYITMLAKFKQDKKKILESVDQLFQEVEKTEDWFHGRSKRVAVKLLETLAMWGNENSADKDFAKLKKKYFSYIK